MSDELVDRRQQDVLDGSDVAEQERLRVIDAPLSHEFVELFLQCQEARIGVDHPGNLRPSLLGPHRLLQFGEPLGDRCADLGQPLEFLLALSARANEDEVAHHPRGDVDPVLHDVRIGDLGVVVVDHGVDRVHHFRDLDQRDAAHDGDEKGQDAEGGRQSRGDFRVIELHDGVGNWSEGDGTPTASSQRPVPGAGCARRTSVPGSPRQSRDFYFGTAPILQRASPQMKRRAQFRRSNGKSVRIYAVTQAYFSFSVPMFAPYLPIGDIGRTQNERYSPPIAAIQRP